MGLLGVPTYGSSGYDWASSPSIWFDSAAVGTIGSLNDFRGDEEGEVCTPEVAARYNGIARVLRPTSTFEVLPIGTISPAPTLGAHAHSWARFEAGQLVLLAWRPPVPGQENPLLQSEVADPRVRDAVYSSVPVVVASKTGDSITRSNNLALVSYGSGEIDLRRELGTKAEIVAHYFGGDQIKEQAAIEGHKLKITVQERNRAGKPLEWIDLRIS